MQDRDRHAHPKGPHVDEPSVVGETICRLEVPVKHQRIEVGAVRLYDGAQFVIDA
jgi:hypothetical protein